jgi:hypothetical protein
LVQAPPAPAVSAALTDTEVRVSSGFRGARIVLYGAVFDPKDRPSDIVVIVRGPDQPIRIARKVQVAGLWINSRPVVFRGAPGFYMAASTGRCRTSPASRRCAGWEPGSSTWPSPRR